MSPQAVARRQRLGAAGEQLAAGWYEAHGYTVFDRNWRCREGELDLVVGVGRQLVFCEVKTRSTATYGVPAAAVTTAKQRRIRRLALRWLDAHPNRSGELRFDVAAVLAGDIEVLEGAF